MASTVGINRVFMAVYLDCRGLDSSSISGYMEETRDALEACKPDDVHFFFIPQTDFHTRIEMLNPSPLIVDDPGFIRQYMEKLDTLCETLVDIVEEHR
ncbi:hypothetical protein HN588_05745 [Candidatus Bathyarchaeota archaeon]|jgi:hypothetical protein|nr:hypothetical protein [Candidatus Bathyarchaeota archaeon]